MEERLRSAADGRRPGATACRRVVVDDPDWARLSKLSAQRRFVLEQQAELLGVIEGVRFGIGADLLEALAMPCRPSGSSRVSPRAGHLFR
jgi:hypothetical protein